MKVKLLKRLRKKAKKKIRLYQVSDLSYKITSPYTYQTDTFTTFITKDQDGLNTLRQYVVEERREYILTCINRMRKEKKNYPILINI